MTIRSRIALGVTAAVVSLGLALAPAAFAQDKMSKDDGMKKENMSKDAMSKDAMKKDDGIKKDGMKNDAMKDGMKKDDDMRKNGASCPQARLAGGGPANAVSFLPSREPGYFFLPLRAA
jgi:pentapeptide MXKDX repeat protein